ncbi:hypothetical protein OPIT5_13920 [Opitutaceae bacterium TAV5]|nr:hypothetical protein OPIT5_13920 [Opitutaceae bacterium TAV5]
MAAASNRRTSATSPVRAALMKRMKPVNDSPLFCGTTSDPSGAIASPVSNIAANARQPAGKKGKRAVIMI